MKALVINSGSSSVKFELFELDHAEERSVLAGEVERIGSVDATLRLDGGAGRNAAGGTHQVEARDHAQALNLALDVVLDGGSAGPRAPVQVRPPTRVCP